MAAGVGLEDVADDTAEVDEVPVGGLAFEVAGDAGFLHLELDFFREGLDLGAGRTGREHEVLGDEGEVRDLQDFDFLGFLRVQDFGDLFGFF